MEPGDCAMVCATSRENPRRATPPPGRTMADVDNRDLEHTVPGAVIAVRCTVRPATVQRLGRQAAKSDATPIDVRTSDGNERATKRTLCFMVGGESNPYERHSGTYDRTPRRRRYQLGIAAGL